MITAILLLMKYDFLMLWKVTLDWRIGRSFRKTDRLIAAQKRLADRLKELYRYMDGGEEE